MWLGLAALCVLVTVQNWNYFRARPGYVGGTNCADYLLQSVSVAYTLTGDPSQHFAPGVLTRVSYKGPLFPLVGGVFGAIGGKSLPVYNPAATLFLLLAMVAVFDIGRRVGNAALGLAAAALLAGLPTVAGQSLTHTPEIAQMAMVAWAVALLLRPGMNFAVAAGLLAGLAMLSRGTAFIYITAPVAWAVAVRWRQDDEGRKAALSYLGLFTLGALLVCGPWYLVRLEKLASDLSYHLFDFFNKYQAGHTETGRFFLAELWRANSLAVFVLFLVSLAGGLWKRLPGFAYFALWFALPFIVFAIAPADIARFMIPTYPAIALAIVAFVGSLRPRALTAALLVVLVLFAFVGRLILLEQWQPESFQARQKLMRVAPLAVEGQYWPHSPDAVAALARHAPAEEPLWLGIIDYGEHEGSPPALVTVLWSFVRPLQGTIKLRQRIATPFDLKLFAQSLPSLDYVLVLATPKSGGWPGDSDLAVMIAQRGPLQERDYAIPTEESFEVIAAQGKLMEELDRRSIRNAWGSPFDLVLWKRKEPGV